MQPVATKTRTYNSTRRSRQAAQTRDEILTAAGALFAEHGWTGTTLAAIAAKAGVAVETIYAGFGSKKGVLHAALDVAVVGDTEPVPLAQRPESLRLGEGSIEERMDAAADLVTDVHERSAGLWRALLEASRSDAELDRWRIEADARRKIDIARSCELMFGRPIEGRQLDLLWAILGNEVYGQLVVDGKMSRADYESCLTDVFTWLAPAP